MTTRVQAHKPRHVTYTGSELDYNIIAITYNGSRRNILVSKRLHDYVVLSSHSVHSLAYLDAVSRFSNMASLFPQMSSMLLYPLRPRVISVSASNPRSTSSTPSSPPKTSPYTNGRPTSTRECIRILVCLQPIFTEKKRVLTEYALGAHRNRLDHVTSLADPRVK